MVDLSIIIVNTNNCKLLEECLGSIRKNTKKTSFEIIVVDNASRDGSQEMVKSKFPDVRLIENTINMGFIKASNQGLRIYKGRYACLLNDDTVVKDRAFDFLVEYMDQNPNAGACSPTLLNTDGTFQHQGSVFQKKFWLSKVPIEIDFAIGACLLVRKEVIDKVGILDENLFFYNDDIDWCKRIVKAGYKIFFIPKAEVVHYGGYSSKRVFNRRLFVEGFRGGLYFSKKHYGNLAYQIYRFVLMIGILLALPFILVFRFSKFSAYLDILTITFTQKITAS